MSAAVTLLCAAFTLGLFLGAYQSLVLQGDYDSSTPQDSETTLRALLTRIAGEAFARNTLDGRDNVAYSEHRAVAHQGAGIQARGPGFAGAGSESTFEKNSEELPQLKNDASWLVSPSGMEKSPLNSDIGKISEEISANASNMRDQEYQEKSSSTSSTVTTPATDTTKPSQVSLRKPEAISDSGQNPGTSQTPMVAPEPTLYTKKSDAKPQNEKARKKKPSRQTSKSKSMNGKAIRVHQYKVPESDVVVKSEWLRNWSLPLPNPKYMRSREEFEPTVSDSAVKKTPRPTSRVPWEYRTVTLYKSNKTSLHFQRVDSAYDELPLWPGFEQHLLDTESPRPNVTAAVLYLYRDDIYLNESFRGVCKYFLLPQYPVILMFEPDRTPPEKIKAMTELYASECNQHRPADIPPSPIYWQPIAMPDLSHLSQSLACRVKPQMYGYVQMCRLYTDWIFRWDWVQELDYVMRLDTDSALASEVFVDPFAALAARRAVYGYHAMCMDWAASHPFSFFSSRLKPPFNYGSNFDRMFDPKSNNYNALRPMYYTNFEVLDVRFFVMPRIHYFARLTESSACQDRWGDAPIRAMLVGVFAEQRHVLHLNYFAYVHGRLSKKQRRTKTRDDVGFLSPPFNPMEADYANCGKYGPDGGHCWHGRLTPEYRNRKVRHQWYAAELAQYERDHPGIFGRNPSATTEKKKKKQNKVLPTTITTTALPVSEDLDTEEA